MHRFLWIVLIGLLLVFVASPEGLAQQAKETSQAKLCVECHKKETPNIVTDWQISRHSENDVGCADCHGDKHTSEADVAKAGVVLPETCAACHPDQLRQFMGGKHALAWTAMKAMPTLHFQPMAMIEGLKGCGACHRLGIKSETEIEELVEQGAGFGVSSCDTCHTRHLFSIKEAQAPQACRTCHMGFDHAQWEMYSSSKHGVRYLLKQNKVLPENVAAPTCQTCHMQDGDHGVMTAWGFLAVRLPLPENKQWANDRATILKALGVLDPQGEPTERFEAVKAAKVARLTQEDWQQQRDRMLQTCEQCHSVNFAKAEMEKGDLMIRQADRLMAQGIETVAGLYQDKILTKPEGYPYPYPDLLTFHDAPTVIEQKLFIMFLEHRMRTFQGTFHSNPDYAFWYGWSKMQRDLTEIDALAERMRADAGTRKQQ